MNWVPGLKAPLRKRHLQPWLLLLQRHRRLLKSSSVLPIPLADTTHSRRYNVIICTTATDLWLCCQEVLWACRISQPGGRSQQGLEWTSWWQSACFCSAVLWSTPLRFPPCTRGRWAGRTRWRWLPWMFGAGKIQHRWWCCSWVKRAPWRSWKMSSCHWAESGCSPVPRPF